MLGNGGHGWLDSYWGLIVPGGGQRVRHLPAAPVHACRSPTTCSTPRASTAPASSASSGRSCCRCAGRRWPPRRSSRSGYAWEDFFWPLIIISELRQVHRAAGPGAVRGEEPHVVGRAVRRVGDRHAADGHRVHGLPAPVHPGHRDERAQGLTGPRRRVARTSRSSPACSPTATASCGCEPAWVARDFLPPGRRLGLPEDAYDVGERGFDLRAVAGLDDAGRQPGGPGRRGAELPRRRPTGSGCCSRDAVEADPVGDHGRRLRRDPPRGLGRLAKLFDYARPAAVPRPPAAGVRVRWWGARPRTRPTTSPPASTWARTRSRSSACTPGSPSSRRTRCCCPYLVDWDSDLILRHSRAELQVADEGFHIPSGVLHAPGTALTLELQEDSDVLAMFQALNAGRIISKDLLFKDVRPEDRAAARGAVPAGLRRLGAQRRPVLLREPPPEPAAGRGVLAARRRGVVDLLQHAEVQREEARRAARAAHTEHRRAASTTCSSGAAGTVRRTGGRRR